MTKTTSLWHPHGSSYRKKHHSWTSCIIASVREKNVPWYRSLFICIVSTPTSSLFPFYLCQWGVSMPNLVNLSCYNVHTRYACLLWITSLTEPWNIEPSLSFYPHPLELPQSSLLLATTFFANCVPTVGVIKGDIAERRCWGLCGREVRGYFILGRQVSELRWSYVMCREYHPTVSYLQGALRYLLQPFFPSKDGSLKKYSFIKHWRATAHRGTANLQSHPRNNLSNKKLNILIHRKNLNYFFYNKWAVHRTMSVWSLNSFCSICGYWYHGF
jgi:hypothetical protein